MTPQELDGLVLAAHGQLKPGDTAQALRDKRWISPGRLLTDAGADAYCLEVTSDRPATHRCCHQPTCPPAHAPDHDAAKVLAHDHVGGYSILCNGVIVFDDTGEIVPDRDDPRGFHTEEPHRNNVRYRKES